MESGRRLGVSQRERIPHSGDRTKTHGDDGLKNVSHASPYGSGGVQKTLQFNLTRNSDIDVMFLAQTSTGASYLGPVFMLAILV